MASIIQADSFTKSALAQNGITVSRTPVTISFTGNGDEIQTDETPENIFVIFHLKHPTYEQTDDGLMKTQEGYIMTGPTQTINKNDKITFNGETYRIRMDPVVRGPSGSTAFYKYAEITLIS